MHKNFKKLKRNRKADFERLRGSLGFNLGEQKRTRLKRALRRDCRTLLEPDIAEEYAGRLQIEMYRHWGHGWRTKEEEQTRLRFLTVLDSLEPLGVGDVVQAAQKLARRIQAALEEQRVWCLGVVEIELVNRARLQQAAASQKPRQQSVDHLPRHVLRGKLRNASAKVAREHEGDAECDNTRRKHAVIESMVEPLYRYDDGTFALVHFHGLVDLGHWASNSMKHEAVAKHLRKLWAGNFRVDLKETFSDQGIGKKFDAIAQYMTKGGNENLRYKDKFGREQVEGKIWREGLGRADTGGETVEDEHGLTIGEIRDLDAIYKKLMGKDGDGFVVRVSFKKHRKKRYNILRKQH